MVSFGCCIFSLCQAVAAQETDSVGVSIGGYGVAKVLGCSCDVDGSGCTA